MLRDLIIVVFLLSFMFLEVVSQSGNEEYRFEHKCTLEQNYSPVLLRGDANIIELEISDCEVVDLGYGFLGEDLNLKNITFHNIQRLILQATFPSELTELHMSQVGLETLNKNNFYGDTRIKQLRIHNSTLHEIKSNTFEDIAVENAHFEHVDFRRLEIDALAFGFNMTANIYFHGCRFPDLDVSPISVAAPGKIKFKDNILNCTNLAQTYDWLDQMVGEQKQKDLICRYLDENFCESKNDGNELIRKLFDSGRLSDNIGIRLSDSCPEQYQRYMTAKPRNAGWLAHVNRAVLSVCFGTMLFL